MRGKVRSPIVAKTFVFVVTNSLKIRCFFAPRPLVLACVLFVAGVAAQAAETMGELTDSSADAIRKAYAWSMDVLPENDDMPGIAILIAYGTGNGMSVKEVGEAFVSELDRRGYMARYFYYNADWPGATVEYHIGYSVRGPWDAQMAASQMSEMTELAKGARNVHKSLKPEGVSSG